MNARLRYGVNTATAWHRRGNIPFESTNGPSYAVRTVALIKFYAPKYI